MWDSMKKQGDSPRGVHLTQDLTTVKSFGSTRIEKYRKEGFEAEKKQMWMLQGPPPATQGNKGDITMESSLPSRYNNLIMLNQLV